MSVTDLYRFSYEPPMAPDMEILQVTAIEAFPMAIVGFAVAFSVAKVYSAKHDYTIDGNQVCGSILTLTSLTASSGLACYYYKKQCSLSDLVAGADSLRSEQHLWGFL